MTVDEEAIEEALERLDLEARVRLLTGADFWSLHAEPTIDLETILVSDGPSGVRGALWDERDPSLSLPSATALAATWDPVLAYRYGAVAASEARRKGVDVVLGPTINLHRSPLGGRHFEGYSEDPELTGAFAVAFIRGVQDHGIGACPKHYVANDAETDRFTVSNEVPERALRELYLAPFERAVTEARPWTLMSAYNAVNGVTMTENDLLRSPLKDEWGFDGVVISDWMAVRSLAAAGAAQDLVMPGPVGAWGDALVAAVRDGSVPADTVADKVRRILRLAQRVGALGSPAPKSVAFGSESEGSSTTGEDGAELARLVAGRGMVLVRNQDDLLPLSSVSTIAVIGQAAKYPRTQGGGSATVIPAAVVSPLEGLREAFPDALIDYRVGTWIDDDLHQFSLDSIVDPQSEEPGIHVEFLSSDGTVVMEETRQATNLTWLGNAPTTASRLVITTDYAPPTSDPVELGVGVSGHVTLCLDDEVILDAAGTTEVARADDGTLEDLDMEAFFPKPHFVAADLEVGMTRRIRATFDLLEAAASRGLCSAAIGWRPVPGPAEAGIAAAARAAAAADVAIVVVGTTEGAESEGFDRTTLALPGRQDDLVEAVAAANARTIVVVNAGAPVLMPWRDRVSSVILSWFGGQEYGHALADVLSGRVEPGGRLPTTWPEREEDVPVLTVTPTGGTLRYDEGVFIGYRAWQRSGRHPAYPFGFGLGYTTWSYKSLMVAPQPDGSVEVTIAVRNTGARPGREVLQAYLARPDSAVERPRRWLAGSAVVEAEPGQSTVATVRLRRRAFEYWDERTAAWVLQPGTYTIEVGRHVDGIELTGSVTPQS